MIEKTSRRIRGNGPGRSEDSGDLFQRRPVRVLDFRGRICPRVDDDDEEHGPHGTGRNGAERFEEALVLGIRRDLERVSETFVDGIREGRFGLGVASEIF